MKRILGTFGYATAVGVCFLLGASMIFGYTAMRFTGFLLWGAGLFLLVLGVLAPLCGAGKRWAKVLRRTLLILFAAGLLLFAAMEIWVLSWARTDEETSASAVIVLGAGVNGTVPSLSLRVRLDAALEYVQDKPDIPIVVTGAQGPGELITEARCMADWLAARGIDASHILLEEQATNTRENIAYSLELLAASGVDVTDNIAVVSADYHLCRAAYLWSAPNMVPVAAEMPGYYWPLTLNYYMREAFAMAAEVLLP